ncbi:MAG: hypothetical protein QNJ94_00435 [Alphaproteobacteria bacterium]|nr:hypothetical protein [Alphaproteobacteria bacterium]
MTIWDPNLRRIYGMRPDLFASPPIRRDQTGVIDFKYYAARAHRGRSNAFWSAYHRFVGMLRALPRRFAGGQKGGCDAA